MFKKSALYNIHNGDLLQTDDDMDVIIHVANCQNVMGKGFALSLKNLYPQAYEADLKTTKGDRNKLGTCSTAVTTRNGKPLTIVNMYAQYSYGKGNHLELPHLISCLKHVAETYKGKRIVMPRMGAGNAGGSWYEIADCIHEHLATSDYRIYVYMYVGIRHIRNTDPNTVLCDRSTVLGNPYPLPKYTRDEACDLHHKHLLHSIYVKRDVAVIERMRYLYGRAKQGGLSLSCHCAPKRCHTEGIRDVLYMKHYAKVIVAGGRDYTNYKMLSAVLHSKLKLFEHAQIVTGMAKGADKLGLQYAKEHDVPYVKFPANWSDVSGKPANEIRTNQGGEYWVKAGYARNLEMAEYGSVLIAFHNGKSKGTADMIQLARDMRLLVFVIKY